MTGQVFPGKLTHRTTWLLRDSIVQATAEQTR